ncbi:MAG: glycine cleavage system protein H [Dehalococcoidia bacterium]
MGFYNGCEVPEDLHYDIDLDVWIRFEADNDLATLGMTDLAQAQCGKLLYVRFKAPGRKLERGKPVATIESAKWVGPFPTPLSGEIAAVNEEGFTKDILVANKDPYEEGWLVKIHPTNLDEEVRHLVTGVEAFEAYRHKIIEKEVTCMRCAD